MGANMIMTIIYSFLGAAWRALWGGWNPLKATGFEFKKALKLVLNYGLSFAAGFFLLAGDYSWPIAALFGLATALTIGVSIAHPLGHGWAHGMGTEVKPAPDPSKPDRLDYFDGGPLHLCVAVFWGNYAVAMFVLGGALTAITHSGAGIVYGLCGLLTPVPHILAQVIDRLFKPKYQPDGQGFLFDGATRFGELGLGAIIFGALPLAMWVA